MIHGERMGSIMPFDARFLRFADGRTHTTTATTTTNTRLFAIPPTYPPLPNLFRITLGGALHSSEALQSGLVHTRAYYTDSVSAGAYGFPSRRAMRTTGSFNRMSKPPANSCTMSRYLNQTVP